MKTVTRIAAVAGFTLSSFAAVAAFAPGMSLSQIDNEVMTSLKRNDTLSSISENAKTAGVAPGLLVSSLISQGQVACDVVTATVAAGYDANDVIKAAAANGAKASEMISCAIAGGADPTTLTEATAAGAGDAGGQGIAGGPGNFGTSPSPTFSGGGGGGGTTPGSVSGS